MKESSPKALILVVEDNEDVRNVITIYLRRNGYAVSEASDGIGALEATENVNPDLILLDVLLPRLDGIEVLKKLRRSSVGKNVPVVMMSAVLQTRDLKAETSRFRVSSFLQKPFQMRSLMEHVKAALRNHRQVEQSSSVNLISNNHSGWKAEKRLQMERRDLETEGNLIDVPVPEILHRIFVESRTGRLCIFSTVTEKRIYFQNGLPVYAESSIPEETLGSYLVRNGKISPVQHRSALEEMNRTGRHFGEVLLKLGLLGPHDLFIELESHLTEKVISTFAWTSGTYRFEGGDSWKDDVIVVRMKSGRILLDGIQRFWTPGNVQKKLNITDLSRTFPLDASPYSEDQLGFSTQETRILQMVKRGLTLGEITKNIGNLALVTSTLYALYVMEYLGFVLQQNSRAPKPFKANTFSGHGSRATKDAHARTLLAEYLKFRTADYFKLLGLSRDITDNEKINLAFSERQRRYHPDSLIGIDTGLVHEKIEELYVRIHNAYRTLIDPVSRERYLKQLEDTSKGAPVSSLSKTKLNGAPVSTRAKTPAELFFEQGFSLLRNNALKRAFDFFISAEKIEPRPRYQAYRVWTAYLLNPKEEKKSTEEKLYQLQTENSEEALYPYLLGNMALREKDFSRAAYFFKRAITVDPQHIDSTRQLQLLRTFGYRIENSGLFDLP